MSRCFPYPPPGYTLSKASNEALIESIKLRKQKEKEKAKAQRKEEKRREKKEKKRKEKKEKKRKEKANQKSDKSDIAKGEVIKKIWTDTKGEFLHNKIEKAEIEQLEKSSLTEENGQPVCLRTCSSDSTENSNKRKRQSSSSIDGGHGGQSNIILVCLPSKKQNEFDALVNEQDQQQLCSTSGRTEKTQTKDDIDFGQIKDFAMGKIELKKSKPNAMTRLELQYKDLIVEWDPPLLDDACLFSEDLNWLFQGERVEKRLRCEDDVSMLLCSRSMVGSWPPRAEYLPEADIYALPFTVPF